MISSIYQRAAQTGYDFYQSPHKLASTVATTTGLYFVGQIGQSLMRVAESRKALKDITPTVLSTTDLFLGFVDGFAILEDFGKIRSARSNSQRIKCIVNMVGVNLPSTLLLLKRFDLLDLGKLSANVGFPLDTTLVPFSRCVVIALKLSDIYEGIQSIRNGNSTGNNQQMTAGILKTAAATAKIVEQLFFLVEGESSIHGRILFGFISAGTGLVWWIYDQGQNRTATGILQTAEGVYNLTKLDSSIFEAMIVFVPLLKPYEGILKGLKTNFKSISEVVKTRNIFDRIIRFRQETGDLFKNTKFFFLTMASSFQLVEGLRDYGVKILENCTDDNLRYGENVFMLGSTIMSLGKVSYEMYQTPAERTRLRNYLTIAKDVGKVGLITLSTYRGEPAYIAFSVAVGITAMAKTAYG